MTSIWYIEISTKLHPCDRSSRFRRTLLNYSQYLLATL